MDSQYTVHLEVRVNGPERDWDHVAGLLTDRLAGMRLRDGFTVSRVAVDEPIEEDVA